MDTKNDQRSWIEATRDCWGKRCIELEPGALASEIESTELVLGFQFPADMKGLYLVVNGFKDFYMDDDNLISVWSMARIRREYSDGRDRNFVGFCDYLINSHCIGFFKDRPGVYKDYDQASSIADSFRMAVEFILANNGVII